MDLNLKSIEDEIESRILWLKNELDEIFLQFKNELKKIKTDIIKYMNVWHLLLLYLTKIAYI